MKDKEKSVKGISKHRKKCEPNKRKPMRVKVH